MENPCYGGVLDGESWDVNCFVPGRGGACPTALLLHHCLAVSGCVVVSLSVEKLGRCRVKGVVNSVTKDRG